LRKGLERSIGLVHCRRDQYHGKKNRSLGNKGMCRKDVSTISVCSNSGTTEKRCEIKRIRKTLTWTSLSSVYDGKGPKPVDLSSREFWILRSSAGRPRGKGRRVRLKEHSSRNLRKSTIFWTRSGPRKNPAEKKTGHHNIKESSRKKKKSGWGPLSQKEFDHSGQDIARQGALQQLEKGNTPQHNGGKKVLRPQLCLHFAWRE